MSLGLAGASLLGRVWAACCFAAATTLASAQGVSGMAVEGTEPALRCLIVPARVIEYPSRHLSFKTGALIRVRLTFTGGEESPRTEVYFDTAGDVFRALVVDRVEAYRMPCLEPGESRVVTQEFQFVSGDGRTILTGEPRAAGRSRVLSCITGGERPPAYPYMGGRSEVTHGHVLARAEFTAADTPPRVTVLFDGGNERFARVVREHMSGYRVPCLQPAEYPLTMSQPFHFRLDGMNVTMLKDATLAAFVRNLANLSDAHVRFDFATMGCPFDLDFALWQPYAKNVVGQIGTSDPNRREFIEWLRGVDLNAPKKLHDELVGDSMKISVPCGVLDLL